MSKKELELQFNFQTIKAFSEVELEIFTNSFNYYGDDYFHKNTGSLFGVIQVSDHSKNSEYLPNLLTSIIKKAFYSQTKSTPEENFEVALKKANLALADLSEHDITNWNNNLHAIVGIFDKDNLLFTQVGNALIFLGRNGQILNLSEPNPVQTTHPIKTFKDIVIGEIKPKDKIIIATPTLLDIFSNEDLSRLFKTFSSKEFDDIIIKTLKKEGEDVNMLINNITAKTVTDYSKDTSMGEKNIPLEKLTKNKNFLGENIKNEKESLPKKKKLSKKSQQKSSKKLKSPENISKKQALDIAKKEAEKSLDKKNKTKKKSSSVGSKNSLKKSSGDKSSPRNKEKNSIKEKRIAKKKNVVKPAKTKTTPKLNDVKPIDKKKESPKLSPFEEMKEIYIKDDDIEKKAKKPSSKKLKNFFNNKKKKIPKKKIISEKQITSSPTKDDNFNSANNTVKNEAEEKKLTTAKLNSKKININYLKIISSLKHFLGSVIVFSKNNISELLKKKPFSKNFRKPTPTIPPEKNDFLPTKRNALKKFLQKIILFSKRNYKISIIILLFLIITPLIMSSFSGKKQKEETLEKLKLPEKTPASSIKNIVADKNTTRKILSLPEEINLLAGNEEKIIVYGKNSKFYEIDKSTSTSETISTPNNIKLSEIKAIDYITSLNLFFLSSDKATISYSPKVKKFIPNKITLPTDFKLAGQNTYLSYLYLLDKTSKQIYRYPRATGGFATGKTWLKKPLDNNSEPTSMAIDENVRVAFQDGTVEKYSRGKLVNKKKFNLKSLDFIETNEELKSYYLLSKDSGKILKVNKSNDQIEKEYQNSAIQKTTTFVVDEEKKLLYISSGKELLSIDL